MERNAAEVMNISVFSGVKFELIISRLVSRATVQRLYHYGPTKRMYCISPACYTAPLNVCFPPFLFRTKEKKQRRIQGSRDAEGHTRGIAWRRSLQFIISLRFQRIVRGETEIRSLLAMNVQFGDRCLYVLMTTKY